MSFASRVWAVKVTRCLLVRGQAAASFAHRCRREASGEVSVAHAAFDCVHLLFRPDCVCSIQSTLSTGCAESSHYVRRSICHSVQVSLQMSCDISATEDGWVNLPSAEEMRKLRDDSVANFQRYSPDLRKHAASVAQRIVLAAQSQDTVFEYQLDKGTHAEAILAMLKRTPSWPAEAFSLGRYCHIMCNHAEGTWCGYVIRCKPFWAPGWDETGSK